MRFCTLLTCLVLCLAATAHARTWHVPAQAPTIQAGLDSAGVADTVLVACGVYYEHDLMIKKNLVLRSEDGRPECVTINANLQGRVMSCVDVGPSTRIEGFTFRGGSSAGFVTNAEGGGLYLQHADVTLSHCVLRGNVAGGDGGGIYVEDCLLVRMEFCDIVGNAAYKAGGAPMGGGLTFRAPNTEGMLSMAHCRVDSNMSGGPGGGICVENASLALLDCEITYNSSGKETWPAGAGLFMRRVNGAETGPIAKELLLLVTQCRLAGNFGTLHGPPFAGDGGGILVKGHDENHLYDVSVTETVFEDNYNAQGAGLYLGRYTNGLVRRSSFLGNRAYLDGGGANKGGRFPESLGEIARFEYCEFIENDAGYDQAGQPAPDHGRGGAFMTRLYPRAEFLNCSFLNNRCGGGTTFGDAIYHYSEGYAFDDTLQRCLLINSVFYGLNGQDVQIRSDADGFTQVSNCAFAAGEYVCDGVVPLNPVLLTESPFYSLGDPHLHPGSPCIDEAVDLGFTLDIDWNPVPTGEGPDIGAYENGDLSGTLPLPASTWRLSAAPNPFNPLTTVFFHLPSAQSVRLAIFDLTGRRVALLADGQYPAGENSATWDGTDRAGRPVASGTYLVRLLGARAATQGKLMLVR